MRWLLLPPDLRATEEQVQLLATTIAYSFAASVSLLLIWRHIIAPRLPGYKFTKPSDRVFLGNSFVSLYPALTAPILAMVSMRRLSWDVGSAMLSGPDDAGLRAVGISCGYMAYDVCYCSYYREVRSPLIIGHHVLPVLLWPFAVLSHRANPMVLFYVLTEITNLGQHGRMLLLKLGYEQTTLYKWVGTSWVVVFFLIRILPSPYMLYHLLRGDYAPYSALEFGITIFFCPLPFILNSYWFYMLFAGVIRFLTKRDRKRA